MARTMKKEEGKVKGWVEGQVPGQRALNPCRRLIYAGSSFPQVVVSQIEHPHSGKGCPQQVSKGNSHIWGVRVGGVSLCPSGNLSVTAMAWATSVAGVPSLAQELL